MSNIKYEFFMSQIKHIRDIKESEKIKISLVYFESMQAPCILKLYKKRDLSEVCQVLMDKKHPNIVAVYDFVYENGNTYVIEEFVAGKTLLEIMQERGTFTERETARIVVEVCNGLEVLHKNQPPVIHNDIKSSNIMMRQDGSVKLVDFDISRTYKEGADKNTRLFGTEEYAAPEHYGFGQSEPCTDVYSLGVTMHELLTGKGLTTERQITYRGSLRKIIGKCVEIDRRKRYMTAHLLKNDLERFMNKRQRIFSGLKISVCSLLLLAGLYFGMRYLADDSVGNFAEKKMKTIGKVDGTLYTMLATEDGVFITLEEKAGKYYIKTSDGLEKELEGVKGWYGCKLVYDRYSDSLYLFEFTDRDTKIYSVDGALDIVLEAYIAGGYSFDKSNLPCGFFSDGMMVCSAMFQILDSQSWVVVGDAPGGSYVINDKIYRYQTIGNCFVEVDAQDKVIKEYKGDGFSATVFYDQIYVTDKYAYFIADKDNCDYLYRFDGEVYEIVTCLEDYKYYSSFQYDHLCVTDKVIRCYDTELGVIKEFTLQ